MDEIRNFSIIAHIDHGKSTLSDRLIQICGGLTEREMVDQVLDSMDLERERGITIKAHSVTLVYRAADGRDYQLNFIDTPGHVDFAYEVSRSLAACEGALLVVDAAQGVEAQSVATCYTAVEQGLTVLPVINKIDLSAADPERVASEIEDIIGIDASGSLRVSAKSGLGVPALLESIVARIPPPTGDPHAPLEALIFDSRFDNYLGVVSLIRVVNGSLRRGDRIRMLSTAREYQVERLGVYTPKPLVKEELRTGEVGFLMAGIRDIDGAPVGDTVTHARRPAPRPVPGFKSVKPQVYAGLYPTDSGEYENFRDALSKLRLSDSALHYEPETSAALGFGFRCGFLGMLHMEIVRERLEREYGLELVTTAPSVVYEVLTTAGETLRVDGPVKLPPVQQIAEMREPLAKVEILVPQSHLGAVIKLCTERRGTQKRLSFVGRQAVIQYEIPLSEIVLDLHDRLKSVSRGFASLDYHFERYAPADLVKLDILINGEIVDALSGIVHRDKSQAQGRALVERMREIIPRQLYEVAIQASVGSRIIARESVKALRKNVTAKCYGGDVTRKRKLLEKQKAGKRRMKQLGRVEIPQEAFLAVLRVERT